MGQLPYEVLNGTQTEAPKPKKATAFFASFALVICVGLLAAVCFSNNDKNTLRPWLGNAVETLSDGQLRQGAEIVAKLRRIGQEEDNNDKDDRILAEVATLTGLALLDCNGTKGRLRCEGIGEILSQIALRIGGLSPHLQGDVSRLLCWLADVIITQCCPEIERHINFTCDHVSGELIVRRAPPPSFN